MPAKQNDVAAYKEERKSKYEYESNEEWQINFTAWASWRV